LAVYAQDSICGTWELLADALEPGGHRGLLRQGAHAPQQAKRRWARDIAPRVDPECNQSPSFQAFRTGVLRLARTAAN
jgi:hypothetical protein